MGKRKSIMPGFKIALCAIAAAGLIVVFHVTEPEIGSALRWISSLGAAAPPIFVALYVVACVLFVPASIITIGAGVIFGVLWGSILVSVGATAGATCSFLIGRHFARNWVARRIENRPNFKAIDAAVAREGWKIVALTRLSPVFPFNLLNYAYGLTRVRPRDYVIATWVGTLPGTVMYVYIGSLAGNIVAGSAVRARSIGGWILDGVGFCATAAVAAYTARIARDALRRETLEENNGASTGPVPDHSV